MSLFVNIKKKLGNFNLSVNINTDNDTTALFGMSGSGKSVTLKCIAGIITPDSGRIVINDIVVFDSEERINLPPQKRNIGYLPQNFALFPNMTVKENIMTGFNKYKKTQRETMALELIDKFKLNHVTDLYPHQISCGQQQRVALARALATEPNVMLLDEPFSSLDTSLKERLELELKEMLKDYCHDILFVSHSRGEVYRLCDKVCVIDNGKCIRVRDTQDVFMNPETVTEAMLVGVENIGVSYAKDFCLENTTSAVAFMADDVNITDTADFLFDATIMHIVKDVNSTYLVVKAENVTQFIKMSDNGEVHSIGDRIRIGINTRDIKFLK